jgi:pyruvate dehydrogenase E2 component (dihydrolipoamide acetyltransferase)
MFDFKLPDLGEGVHEGQVVNVLVKEGDAIAEYQPMLEVETDKAAVEIPSPKAGVVARVHVEPGQMIKVGQVLVTIDEAGAGGAAMPAKTAKPAAQTVAGATEPARAAALPRAPAAPEPAQPRAGAPPAERGDEGPVAAAPVVRRLARDLGVDINQVVGSGPGGRVLREDVERAVAAGKPGAPAGAPSIAPAMPPGAAELPDFGQWGPVRRVAVPQIRKTIARQMTRAWANVPRVTHGDTADVTDLEHNRKQFNEGLKPDEAKLSLTAIVIKATAAALRQFPMLNASFDAARDEIIYKDYVHMGVAVDTPRGLIVPVLRGADRKPLPKIAAEVVALSERVRSGKFEIAEVRGATFTITNIGPLGGTFFTPMVNFPEVAILGLGRARLQPAMYEGQIAPRLILPLSLSFDHRVVDGADAARFVSELIRLLENPLRLISLV